MKTLSAQVTVDPHFFYAGSIEESDKRMACIWQDLQRRVNDQIFNEIGDDPHTIRIKREVRTDERTMNTILRMTAEIHEVDRMNVAVIEPELVWDMGRIVDDKRVCQYCGQTSPNDERGGCAACGGRR